MREVPDLTNLGTRQYIPALTVINKIDGVSMETLDIMAKEGDGRTVMISCELGLGLDWLLEAIWMVSLASTLYAQSFVMRELTWQELGLVK